MIEILHIRHLEVIRRQGKRDSKKGRQERSQVRRTVDSSPNYIADHDEKAACGGAFRDRKRMIRRVKEVLNKKGVTETLI